MASVCGLVTDRSAAVAPPLPIRSKPHSICRSLPARRSAGTAGAAEEPRRTSVSEEANRSPSSLEKNTKRLSAAEARGSAEIRELVKKQLDNAEPTPDEGLSSDEEEEADEELGRLAKMEAEAKQLLQLLKLQKNDKKAMLKQQMAAMKDVQLPI